MKTIYSIMVTAFLIGVGNLGVYGQFSTKTYFSIVANSGLSREQLMGILEQVHPYFYKASGIAFPELVDMYLDGECIIKVVTDGYEVNGGGGLGTVLIGDFV